MASCFKLAIEIKNAVELVDSNYEECRKISDRVQRFTNLWRRVPKKLPKEMIAELQEFKDCCSGAINLVSSYTKEKYGAKSVWRWVNQMGHADRDNAKFLDWHTRLDRSRSDCEYAFVMYGLILAGTDEKPHDSDLPLSPREDVYFVDEKTTWLINAKDVEYLDFMKSNSISIPKPIGAGNFSSVFRVKYQGSEYALKRISPLDGEGKDAVLARFYKEANLLFRLSHHGIIQMFGGSNLYDSVEGDVVGTYANDLKASNLR